MAEVKTRRYTLEDMKRIIGGCPHLMVRNPDAAKCGLNPPNFPECSYNTLTPCSEFKKIITEWKEMLAESQLYIDEANHEKR